MTSSSQFSTNQDQAERGGLGLKLGNASAKTVISPDDPPQTDDDNPYRQHCTDNARIWRTYMDQAKISDDNLSNIFNSDLDPLLIFAGLFSAILSAFLIDVRKGLEQDLQSITNTLLTILIENQHNTTGNQISPPSHFTPSSSSRWVNGLWFSSLIFSLMSALGASLAKGWLTQFSAIASGSRWNDVGVHCNRFRGVRRWHLTLIIECLPILIHIAFFLFSIGLIILVFQDDTAIGAVILVLTALVAFLYIGSSLHPAYSSDSPFRTPLSGIISSLLKHGWQAEQFSPFSDREDVQKAQALAWLLQASPPVDDVMRPIIQAIAGLPATVFVQDELLQPPIIDFLSRTLANELSRPPLNEDHIIPILYALLHLVQTAPSVVNSDSSRLLLALVNTQGPLFATETMGPGIQALALCVKGRIILLYDHGRGQEVFETDIPVLRASTDGHIRHLLTEVQLLSSHSSTGPTRIDLITHLKNYGRRLMRHHKKLPFRVVINDSALTLARLRPTALFVGLGTTSGKVRRKYAKLFKNLVTAHGIFVL
ncbi:hypothetical protein B0H16DRAFT_1725476 [Mycena metata]|uniref:DUF6535 domain-containing protein n=1 Tax=Mycena metata TaxID=1033252 RepID=A0AAD7N725_9AGAR|nr:hypothetical protein B0H16DRAFT_1725476 [Mycena metata]